MPNQFGVDEDPAGVTLAGHVSGSNAPRSMGRNISPNAYAWFYVVGALALLWLLGGAFKSVLS